MACFTISTTLAVFTTAFRKKVPEKYRIDILNTMLWGGTLMMLVEHMAHGEIVPYPPFFTAGAAEIIPEMLSVGVPMALTIVAIWGVLVTVLLKHESKNSVPTA